MVKNQYLLVKDKSGCIVDKKRWDGEKFVRLKYKIIDNTRFSKVKPLNPEQECFFDMLDNETIIGKLVIGNWGSGKSYIALCWALDKIEKRSNYNKIIYIRNNIEVKDTVSLGALPSGLNEKLRPWAMPIADILGSEIELDRLISDSKIELAHLGFIRSRSFDNAIVIVDECQNLSAEHMALLVSRIGNNSTLIIVGDTRQMDRSNFEKNSGICAIIEALKGDEMFGVVCLRKTERSKFSALAERICRLD
jgi:PhoH-like ATPase